MLKSGASASGPPTTHRDVDGETAEALVALHTILPQELAVISPSARNGPHIPKYTALETSLKFQASLVADLVRLRKFKDTTSWHRAVGVYMTPWLDADQGTSFAEAVRSYFYAIDQVS